MCSSPKPSRQSRGCGAWASRWRCSLAMSSGTDVAIEAADVTLMRGDLLGVVSAVELSRRTVSIVKQNLAWAFGYNLVLIPVAAGMLYPIWGWQLSPILAGVAMALSSVSVVANRLQISR